VLPACKREEPFSDSLSIPLNALEEWVHNCFESVLTARRKIDEFISIAFQVNLPAPSRQLIIG
jgi:hypothetical protein